MHADVHWRLCGLQPRHHLHCLSVEHPHWKLSARPVCGHERHDLHNFYCLRSLHPEWVVVHTFLSVGLRRNGISADELQPGKLLRSSWLLLSRSVCSTFRHIHTNLFIVQCFDPLWRLLLSNLPPQLWRRRQPCDSMHNRHVDDTVFCLHRVAMHRRPVRQHHTGYLLRHFHRFGSVLLSWLPAWLCRLGLSTGQLSQQCPKRTGGILFQRYQRHFVLSSLAPISLHSW